MNISKREMPKLPEYPVPALEKGLDILEALGEAAAPQSLAELAVRLRRSSSELFRMLNCLERRGYLARETASGRYSLSLKLFALAHGHSVVNNLLRVARQPMRALTESLCESCHLSVLERGRLLVVAQEECPAHVRLSFEVGGMFDPMTTASGRLLLAHLGTEERERVIADSPTGRSLSVRKRARFEEALAGLRSRSVSTAQSESIEGVRDFAVLVGRPDRGVMAALAVTRLTRRDRRSDDAALLESVRATAREITGALGLLP